MTISVLGVMGLQAYWINNAIVAKEQQFDQQVQLALNRTNIDIEDIETMQLFVSLTPDSQRLMRPSDRVLKQNSIDSVETVIYTGSSNDGEVFLIIDTVSKDGNTFHQQIEIRGSEIVDEVSVEFNHTQQMVWMEHQQLQAKYEQIGGVMDRVFIEMMREPKTLEARLDVMPVEEVLEENLTIYGVHIDFEYAVVNTRNEPILASEAFNDEKGQYYQAALFPNDLFSEQGLLLVDFPTRTSYVLKSVWGVLALSLIFTGIVVLAFWWMMKLLFSQKRLSEIKTDFINNMTHEFKTPIATITLAADSIQSPGVLSDPTRIKHYVGLIKEENKRMNKQVERILQMSLLDKEDLQVNKEHIEINELVHDVCEHFKLKIQSAGGSIAFKPSDEHLIVNLDRLHLFQSVSNLIENGIKYSDERPSIEVEIQSVVDNVHIHVTDHGIGIPKDQQDKIFEKFYRVPTGDVHNVKGHGLGLNYVKRISAKMDGDIQLSSKPGKGSTFTLIFPVA